MSQSTRRRGFTLVELMMVIAIIAILAAMAMAALAGAAEEGKRQRVRAQIEKIDQLISEKWNAYRYRQLPIRIPSPPAVQPAQARIIRLNVMRELQRMELPDRLTDIMDDPATGMAIPALTRNYRRKISPQALTNYGAGQPNAFDQAECLYLILSEIRDGDKSALQYFLPSEIGDVDADGMYEILDPWGTPIMFLRWAPGYSKAVATDPELVGKIAAPAPLLTVAVSTFQIPDGLSRADAFDPLKADVRWNDGGIAGFKPFLIRPLIFSAGPDRVYDIHIDETTAWHYNPLYRTPAAPGAIPNDPYAVIVPTNGDPNRWFGQPKDYDNDGLQNGDNYTNHAFELEGGSGQ